MPTAPSDKLDIWYVCDMVLCNFDCAYCVAFDARSNRKIWQSDESYDRFKKVVAWIGNLPLRVGVRLQSVGEPFASKQFLEQAVWLSTLPNTRYVELVSNASLIKRRLPKLISAGAADPTKLSIWATFHHTQITLESFLENVLVAKELGVNVVVNGLLFPDTLEVITSLVGACRRLEIRVNVDLGYNYDNVYPGKPYVSVLGADDYAATLLDLLGDRTAIAVNLLAVANPLGLSCSAGFDYIHIREDGAVFPCSPYSRQSEKWCLGSALDPSFVPRVHTGVYKPCRVKSGCACKEDFLHLRFIQQKVDRRDSLGWVPSLHTEESIPKEICTKIRENYEEHSLVRLLVGNEPELDN